MSFSLERCQKNDQGHYLARTKDGRAVRIVCTDADTGQPIVALITYADGDELARHFSKNGQFLLSSPSESDLENIPQRVKRWVNFYGDSTAANAFYSEGDAVKFAEACLTPPIAIAVPVEFEVRG